MSSKRINIPDMRTRCNQIRKGEKELHVILSDEAWEGNDLHYVATMDDAYWITSNRTLEGLMKELEKRNLPVTSVIDIKCPVPGCHGRIDATGYITKDAALLCSDHAEHDVYLRASFKN